MVISRHISLSGEITTHYYLSAVTWAAANAWQPHVPSLWLCMRFPCAFPKTLGKQQGKRAWRRGKSGREGEWNRITHMQKCFHLLCYMRTLPKESSTPALRSLFYPPADPVPDLHFTILPSFTICTCQAFIMLLWHVIFGGWGTKTG